mgnify:CR=1 FL=1
MGSLAIGAAVAALAFLVAWRALPWLRSGRHRYADEADRAARRHTWVLWAVPVVAFLVGAAWSDQPVHAVVFAAFAVFLILISAIDLDVQRLPDRWTKPAMVAAPVATAVLAGLDRELDSWVRSLLAALALGTVYVVLVLLGGGSGMGLGDAKLAPSIGAVLGYLSWAHVIAATLAAILLAGLVAAFLLLTRRAGRKSHFAFGPAMAAGAILVLAAPVVGSLG